MIDIKDKKDCCGCNACGDICPKGSITFKTDIEGFWYPEVNLDSCIDCHLCENVCPILNVNELKKNDLPQSECYAAEHKSLEVIFDSTSGGLFSAFADIIYKEKGYVGGAIYNDDFSVRQYISSNKEDLPKLRSSKYLQSNLEGFFKQVKRLVISGEQVLVCGSPCQMAAMRAFLQYKDYPNLIIADYICRGINSPKVWRKYLDSYEERYGSKVVYVKSKSKELGWRNLTQKTILANGKVYYEKASDNLFTKGYLCTNAYCRPACYDCKFKGFPRISDITLADLWGVEKIKELKTVIDKNIGTSLVMLNSQKGKNFFEKVKTRIHCDKIPFDAATAGNFALIQPLPAPSVDRDQFFKDLDRMTFLQVAEKYIEQQQPTPIIYTNKTIIHQIKEIKWMLSNLLHDFSILGWDPKRIHNYLKLNSFQDILSRNIILPSSNCIINLDEGATIKRVGKIIIGEKTRFPDSKLETRLFVGRNATIEFGPDTKIGYGADIEVFDNAHLIFKGHGGSNIGLTCICADYIEFGDGVMMGRNVTVRDNNGGHYINRHGYKNTSPVIIGDHSWLCESCTIMQGVKVGTGGIVGANAHVIGNVKSFTLVAGNPAKTVDTEVYWKY